LLAGATAVQIGTANFRNPNIYKDIKTNLMRYCEIHKIDHYSELIGKLKLYE